MRKLITLLNDAAAPRAKAGEQLLIDDSLPINPGDEVVIATTNGGLIYKELVSREGGVITLRNVFDARGEFTLCESDIRSIAYVGGIVRRSGVAHA